MTTRDIPYVGQTKPSTRRTRNGQEYLVLAGNEFIYVLDLYHSVLQYDIYSYTVYCGL